MENRIILIGSGALGLLAKWNYESFFAELGAKTVITTVALLVGTTFVHFYKKWLRKSK